MSVERLIRLRCDYCKQSETFTLPTPPEAVSDWIDVQIFVKGESVEVPHGPAQQGPQPVLMNFCSPKCAAQAIKQLEKGRATVAVVEGPAVAGEPLPNKVREVIRVNEDTGAVETVTPAA